MGFNSAFKGLNERGFVVAIVGLGVVLIVGCKCDDNNVHTELMHLRQTINADEI
jgi:hypothetical protein